MAEEYHEISNVIDVPKGDDFLFPRSRALVRAIEKQRDYSIVKLKRQEDSRTEYIVVDVETDKVPPKNPYGIQYRERLAFCIPESARQLIDVRALRKDFPVLIHQNQTHPGDARGLCLYFEPPISVLRTWTPQKFLRRVQWWLEKTARGELHPADQPVEQLFFLSKYELVLPWNFAELRKDPKRSFHVALLTKRRDDHMTFYLEEAKTNGEGDGIRAECIEFNMPPVVHGVIEQPPVTLGQLYDQLQERGNDLLAPLKETLRERVGTQGATITSDNPHTIFLLHVPMIRNPGAFPEITHHRAFIVDAGLLKIGEEIGALSLLEKKYFNVEYVLNSPVKTEWREREITSVEVLHENDAAAARHQSGIQEPGPIGTLIGVGSLGSAMLNLWSRSGWGHWTVIDKDHIKPHNLSRHTAYIHHIGQSKAFVTALLHSAALSDGAITPLCKDACNLDDEDIAKSMKDANLVIDASTTLEYPRQVSTLDDLPRHISVFMTPNGNCAVLLAEDSKRMTRLRALEAQYYRAVIQNDWGKKHLSGNLGTFWSGASCRDISTVLPYSRIMIQAGTLAEHIPPISSQTDAVIRIWERDPSSGSTAVHSIEVYPEHRRKFGELDLFMDEGVEHQLRQLRNTALPNETGGVLLGYYDFNVNAVVVVCGLPSPPDSQSTPGMFERGVSGLAESVKEATERTAGIVGYVGEWHSHPPNHSATPSGDDLIQLLHLAIGMADDGLPALQLIVGEHDVQIIQGIVPL
ncbi:MAG TPA: hypothetical protein DEA55_05395 [Rhodospirillaceae bacterium]|nr:hypothetical protein [Rhodospirillaceae bacterium]